MRSQTKVAQVVRSVADDGGVAWQNPENAAELGDEYADVVLSFNPIDRDWETRCP